MRGKGPNINQIFFLFYSSFDLDFKTEILSKIRTSLDKSLG